MRKNKLLLLLALLLTAATGAWAQDAKHLITATYREQTRSLEQPLPYATTIGEFYEAVTGQSFSDLISSMSAVEMPLTGITSNNTSVVIGELNGASTPVTVIADGETIINLIFGSYVQGIPVSATSPLYAYMKDGVKDADKWTVKVGEGQAQALPIGGLKGDGSETVTLQYTGRLKVKGVKATSDAGAPAAPIEVLTYSFDDASHPSGLTAGSRVSFDYSRTSVITNSKFLNAYNNTNGDPGATTVSLGDTDLSGETWTLSFEWAACGGCNSKPDHTTLKAGDATLFDLSGNSNWNTTVTIIYTGSDGSKTLPVPGCDKSNRFTAAVVDQYNTTTYWHHIVVTGSAEGVKMTITNSSTGAAVVEDVVLSETNVNPTSLIIEPSCGGGIGIDALSLTYEPTAPAAKPAGTVTTAPTGAAIVGVGKTTALVSGGVADGGTLMYAVTTTNTKPTSTAGFSDAVPTAKDITASGKVYVWYYVKADDTHSDSEIAATAIEVPVADIVWDATNISDLDVWSTSKSYTKEGVKLSANAENISAQWADYGDPATLGIRFNMGESGGFTFTAPTGKKFTKIEMNAQSPDGWFDANLGTGWAFNFDDITEICTVTWTGSAASTVGLLTGADEFQGSPVKSIGFYLSE